MEAYADEYPNTRLLSMELKVLYIRVLNTVFDKMLTI